MPLHTYIPATSVVIPENRQRTEFDESALMELASSIKERGLIHAITVRPDGVTLVAGERRLRAIKAHLLPLGIPYQYGGEAVPPGHVPVVAVASDDPLELAEIEWAENEKRKDLTWQEKAVNTAKLNAMRAERASREGKTWTSADLAAAVNPEKVAEAKAAGEALGSLQNLPRLQVIVAKHLDDPEVAKAKTLQDAFKVLKRKEEAKRVTELGAAMGNKSASDLYEVYLDSCLHFMADVLHEKGELFDVILTDPPYGMGAHEFGDGAGRLTNAGHDYNDSYESWVDLMSAWCPLAFAVCKPQAHAYVFCDIDRFHELKSMMQAAGWYVFRTPLINVKVNSGRVPLPDQGPRRQYEILLYAIKGKKQTTAIYSDVIETSADEQLSHGAQKPVALYIDLLRRSVRPGDLVLDSFAGTGTILAAAHEMKCRAVAIEQNPTYYGLCVERLASLA
jgi:DNA modification methylase/ParB-like chromosome segregation protein Spo0J